VVRVTLGYFGGSCRLLGCVRALIAKSDLEQVADVDPWAFVVLSPRAAAGGLWGLGLGLGLMEANFVETTVQLEIHAPGSNRIHAP